MAGKNQTNQRMNIFYLVVTVGLFGTGLVMLSKFHVDEVNQHEMFMGMGISEWMGIHKLMAIGFLTGSIIHIRRYWRYLTNIAKRWRTGMPKKIKTTFLQQLLLLFLSIVVMVTGGLRHQWIYLHGIAGLLLLICLAVHIKRRWRKFFSVRTHSPREGL